MPDQDVILIVDDEENIRTTVRFALEKAGMKTVEAGDGQAALEAFTRAGPDLIILDIMMPELDGVEVCRIIRTQSDTPIIFLTSKDEEIDRVVGLEIGGDDYVPKPFSPRELAARVKAVLRRTRNRSGPAEEDPPPPSSSSTRAHGLLRLDLDARRAYWDETEINLTNTEFNILKTLMGHPGKVYTRDELMDGAYPHDNYVSDRTIDSHVRHVRQKIGTAGAAVVETVHGLGYRLGPCLLK